MSSCSFSINVAIVIPTSLPFPVSAEKVIVTIAMQSVAPRIPVRRNVFSFESAILAPDNLRLPYNRQFRNHIQRMMYKNVFSSVLFPVQQ